MSAEASQVNWKEKYPAPSTMTPPTITREQVLGWINEGKQAGKDFLVVDLRRNDHTGGFIRGSLNLPIESLYPSLPTLHTLCKSAGIKTVIFHCFSSRGRGNRAAAWFGDYLKVQGAADIQSVSLLEGIVGWVHAGPEYTEHIEGFDPEAWSNGGGDAC
ncbi:hypothetical protein SI65_10326 [Aspergillus cristatus]|uniref:Rhodanese domain-containing protein n=1 Tax=Aspergillus cristatus TaxID=573508 RepID=A0A1E3B086_ASPCR|nr:hypothetical protein SI65_10326 [Aspergillus cristatus]